MNQIIFAGGIHGVGKSTLCREVVAALSINYLSASEVLKWNDINTDAKNKKVLDIPDTQKRLLNGLKAIVEPGKRYILDGHFCLFNKDGEVIPVPISTFKQIDPLGLIVVTGPIADIQAALEKRDDRTYDQAALLAMQEKEIAYAQEVAATLRVPLFRFQKDTTSSKELIAQIHESLT
jgi:adenylate kinase